MSDAVFTGNERNLTMTGRYQVLGHIFCGKSVVDTDGGDIGSVVDVTALYDRKRTV